LGGARNLRGIMRNRGVGDGVAYGNTELRWKFYRFGLIKQNFYLALNAFADAGMVVQKVEINKSSIPENVDQSQYFSNDPEKIHVCLGGGFRVVMNQNFIIAADFGKALDKRDGNTGVYIGFGYIF
jgi:hemolysin activation/secretion protein